MRTCGVMGLDDDVGWSWPGWWSNV